MSDRFYNAVEYISKKHGRLALLGASLVLLLPSLLILHYGIDYLFHFVPEEYYGTVNMVEEFILLSFIFLVMWYYHKSRHLLEEHLLQQDRLKLFIKHAPTAVAMVDNEMRYIAASDRWLHDFRVPDDDIIGKSHYDVFSSLEDLPRWKMDHQYCLKGGTIRCEEDSFISLNGRREWLTYELLPWRYPNGSIGGLIFFVEFITERIEAMNRLKESEARFERAMRGSNDGIFDWNIPENKVYFAASFKALMGYQDHEIENTVEGWSNMLHPDDVAATNKAIEEHLKERKPYDVNYRLRHKNGYYIWINARGQAEWDENGNPVYFSGSMADISEKKRLEELKNEFVYVVTHELRTPLSALRGALDMLPRLLGEDLPAKAKRSLDLSLQGCERLTSLVNDLLEVGKAESGSMSFNIQSCNVNDLLNRAVEMNAEYARQFHVSISFRPVSGDYIIQVDENRFQQIMANLLSNAAKFSPPDGVIRIGTDAENQELIINVTDHGSGIPPEFQKRIFQKFARSHSEKPGTGLGLNITKTMVEKMGGRIWFVSEEGEGTSFFIAFPLSSQK